MEAGTYGAGRRSGPGGFARRLTTETKSALKTTEFWAMVGVVLAILISAAAIKGGDTGGTDEFIARQAWLYVAIVAGAYFISRGLAKSGSSDPYWDHMDDGGSDGSVGDRVKAATPLGSESQSGTETTRTGGSGVSR